MRQYPFVHNRDPSRRFFAFDMFETLVRNKKGTVEPIFETLCTYYPGIEPSDISHCYHTFSRGFKETHKNRELPIDEIIRHLDSTFGFNNDPVSMEKPLLRDNHIYGLGEDVKEVLEYLRRKEYRIAVLSNTRYHEFTLRGILEDEGISDLVDIVVTSADMGWRKPAPESYQAVLDALGAKASECFFCGDTASKDYYGPLAVGMKGAVLLDYKNEESENLVGKVDSIRKLPDLFENPLQ
ncbi:MAG: HAD family hydrolase [archaeon]|nr:HAD family hydrolase [archaeon]